MRVGLIIYNTLDTVSGGYLYDRKLVEHLRREGDEVVIFSLPWRSYSRHLLDNASPGLFRKVQKLPVDILLQDELNHPSLFITNRYVKKNASFPIIPIVHHLRTSELNSTPLKHIYAWVERQYLLSADAFIFNSQTTCQSVHSLLKAATNAECQSTLEKPSIIGYPAGDRFSPQITHHQITQRALDNGPLRMVFLGNLIPRKGLHVLLSALAGLREADWRLKVVGNPQVDPAYTRRVKQQTTRLSLQTRVSYLGSLPDDGLAEALMESHVLVVPSTYEGFGIVYLEGMSFGLPAIATNSGGAGEIITHGEDGFLISPGDGSALTEHLSILINDRQRLAEMSWAARQKFLHQPTWEATCQTIRQFLVSMI
jgi:glycosyltransferase involved in cell wall biosynthesis